MAILWLKLLGRGFMLQGMPLAISFVAAPWFAADVGRGTYEPSGALRRMIWISGWLIPVGYALAALFPQRARAGLHVVFIGGLTMGIIGLALVAVDRGSRRAVGWVATLLIAATILRGLIDMDPDRFTLWMAASSSMFIAATIAAMWFFVRPQPLPDGRATDTSEDLNAAETEHPPP